MDRHRVEIAEHDDGGRGLGGIDRLALLGADREHGSVDRGGDAGIAEIDPRGLDGNLGRGDPGIERLDLRLGDRDIALGGFEIGLRNRPPVGQRRLAGECALEITERGRLLRLLGLYLGERCLGGAERVLLGDRVDFGNEIAGLHLVADRHRETGDPARDLRPDRDEPGGLQHAGRQHGILYVAAHHRCGHDLRAGRAREACPVGDTATEQEGEEGGKANGAPPAPPRGRPCLRGRVVQRRVHARYRPYVLHRSPHLPVAAGFTRRIAISGGCSWRRDRWRQADRMRGASATPRTSFSIRAS